MVSSKKDMLSREDAMPDAESKADLVRQIAEGGEAILLLSDGSTVEVHGHDTYFYPGVLFTESDLAGQDDAETWIFTDDIVAILRH